MRIDAILLKEFFEVGCVDLGRYLLDEMCNTKHFLLQLKFDLMSPHLLRLEHRSYCILNII